MLYTIAIQQAAWNVTPSSSNPDINIEYSSAIKEKLSKKGSFASYDKQILSFEKRIKSNHQST